MKRDEIEEIMNSHPPNVTPIFKQSSPNENHILYEGEMLLKLPNKNSDRYRIKGEIRFDWLPSPQVRLDGKLENGIQPIQPTEVTITIEEYDTSVKFQLSSVDMGSESMSLFGVVAEPIWVGKKNKEINKLIFHLPNYHKYLGDSLRHETEGRNQYRVSRGRLSLESKEWLIKIDQKMNYKNIKKKVKREGGYVLGHTGSITHKDTDTFLIKETESLLNSLHYFLSFSRGIWTGPTLSVGINTENAECVKWSRPNLTNWEDGLSWFPTMDLEGISELFFEFHEKWKDELWEQTLTNITHWYIEANLNAGALEGSIILIQTALEHLTWVYLVEDQEKYSTTQFRKSFPETSDKIEELLKTLDVPKDLPEDKEVFSNIVDKLEDDYEINNGPQLYTSVRNMIVHPKKSKRERLAKLKMLEKFEIKQLGLLYIELVILKLLNYEGAFHNRLKRGTVQNMKEQVPWVK